MEIKDLYGVKIIVTDLKSAIEQAGTFKDYGFSTFNEVATIASIEQNSIKNLYWTDLYEKLLTLQLLEGKSELMPEYIHCNEGYEFLWICPCGNTAETSGFEACDQSGEIMEPNIGSTWNGHYLCMNCGRIVNQNNRQIIGKTEEYIGNKIDVPEQTWLKIKSACLNATQEFLKEALNCAYQYERSTNAIKSMINVMDKSALAEQVYACVQQTNTCNTKGNRFWIDLYGYYKINI